MNRGSQQPLHVIRLQSAWQVEVAARQREIPAAWQRHFGCPSGLDERTRVLLVFDSPQAAATVSLNGEWLGLTDRQSARTAFDITDQLLPRNHLSLEITGDNGDLTPAVSPTSQRQQTLPERLGHVRLEFVSIRALP
jgi:beta-galactosidase/beta-glucuronidase